jgi:hypothetical protein
MKKSCDFQQGSENYPPRGLETNSANSLSTSDLDQTGDPSLAKSGAVPISSHNVEALAAVIANRASSSAMPIESTASGDGAGRLASCLAILYAKSPDLALLFERWDSLPDAIRAGIGAMVRTACSSEGEA